jgi:UDP:flavonoid glycosyltransferase YjiC (YdhE family)
VKILFYITGHGYGHATRMTAVMNALSARRPDLQLFARTEAPEWVFRSSVAAPVAYERVRIDAGVVEKDLLAQDVPATLQRCREVYGRAEEQIQAEARRVRELGIDRIVSDIPPLASSIGREAGVPVIAVGNFSWDYIYAPFVERCPGFAPVIAQIRECYATTDLLLRLPWSHEMDAFPRQEAIPLVTRQPQTPRAVVRRRLFELGADPHRPLVLLGGRFPDLAPQVLARVLDTTGVTVVAFSDFDLGPHERLLVLGDDWQCRFLDVLQACDVVVSKIGYGIASESAACRVPVLYPPREEFAEHPIMEEGLARWIPIQRIERPEFERGDWAAPLEALLSRPVDGPQIPVNGAEVAAERILAFDR